MTEQNQEKNAGPANPSVDFLSIVLGGVGLFAVIVLITTWYRANIIAMRTDPSANPLFWGMGTGNFGDAFGFVTSIFTGAAFLGLLITMRMQRAELHEIREERKIAQQTFDQNIQHSKVVEKELSRRHLEERTFRMIELVRSQTERMSVGAPNIQNPNRDQEASYAAEKWRSRISAIVSSHSHKQLDRDTALEQVFDHSREPEVRIIFRQLACVEAFSAIDAIVEGELDLNMLMLIGNALPQNCLVLYAAFLHGAQHTTKSEKHAMRVRKFLALLGFSDASESDKKEVRFILAGLV